MDPDLVDEWATMFESIASEMRTVAEHERIAQRGTSVPRQDYAPVPVALPAVIEPTAPKPVGINGAEPGVRAGQVTTMECSSRYPYSPATNRDAVEKLARRDLERGQDVFIENADGVWEQFRG
jgi:hypothetical protein